MGIWILVVKTTLIYFDYFKENVWYESGNHFYFVTEINIVGWKIRNGNLEKLGTQGRN